MLPLDLLRVPFARAVHFSVQIPRVRAPMIGRKTGEPEGLQQCCALQKDGSFAASKDIRSDHTRAMINRMPQPAWVAFVADKRPHLIHLGFLPSTLDGHCDVVWVAGAQERGVDRFQCGFFLLEFTSHRVRTDPQHPCGIAHTTGVETPINDLVLHLGQPPLVSVVEQKTPCGTRGILAQVPLCAAACFPAFDDLIAVTMRTLDRDEHHGTLLASERCQEKAQCDINLGLSPHLEHHRNIRLHGTL